MELLDYSELSRSVLDEINLARHIPNSLIPSLLSRYEYFNGNIYQPPGELPMETYEGDKGITEAIDFLKMQEPLPVVVEHKGLQKVALEYAQDLVCSGDFSNPHVDSADTTPAQRISKVANWVKMVGECIEVGNITATNIICSLIIDDGNEERSNRKVLFNKDAKMAGVACVPHSVFGVITVIDLIGGEHGNTQ